MQLIFCFVINPEEDPNHKLTGDRLDRLTGELTYSSVFEKIEYYNRTNWNTFRPTNSSRSLDGQLSMTHFYFTNMKCFEISLKVNFRWDHFIFSANNKVLNVFFAKRFLNRTRHVYFLYRKGNSKEFHSFYFFRLGKLRNRLASYRKYAITFESLVIRRDDKFETLKNLRSLFSFKRTSINDVTSYLDSMKQTFEGEYNRTTKEIFLEKKRPNEFRYEIDDTLFDQFARQVQNSSDQNPTSRNYEKRFFNVHTQVNTVNETESWYGEFSFTFYFFQRLSEFTNDDNFSKLLQGILNSLSLWLNNGILDLHTYVLHFFCLFKLLHRLLLDQEAKTKSYLDAHAVRLLPPSQANRRAVNAL